MYEVTNTLSLFLFSENEATSTLSALVEMPHQTRLVELLIASPEVRQVLCDVTSCTDSPVIICRQPAILPPAVECLMIISFILIICVLAEMVIL